MKEFLEKLKRQVIVYVLWAEAEFFGEPGSVNREAVIDKVAALIEIPYVPEFIESPAKKFLIGHFIDLAVDKLNWLTGYSFAGTEISEESQAQLAEAMDAPVAAVSRVIASAKPGAGVEEKIKALCEQYGIKAEATEPAKEMPQQETIQAQPVTQTQPSYQWDKILSFILKREGGYANDPDDPGGETNRGITKATLAAAHAQGLVSHNAVKDVTREDASKIYEARYYKCYGYEKLPFAVSLALTDTTVNLGRGGAAKVAQRALSSLGYAITAYGKWGRRRRTRLRGLLRRCRLSSRGSSCSSARTITTGSSRPSRPRRSSGTDGITG